MRRRTRSGHAARSNGGLNDTREAVIVDVEATPTPISEEVDATEIMVERTEERFGVKPKRLAKLAAMPPPRPIAA